ncbi:hypothetical protein [Streptomyces globisporus]|uniref:hypothetical protein n=1 Tax=Streptomyces globisporus TaxID=1908 RepID=UPI0037F27AF7
MEEQLLEGDIASVLSEAVHQDVLHRLVLPDAARNAVAQERPELGSVRVAEQRLSTSSGGSRRAGCSQLRAAAR